MKKAKKEFKSIVFETFKDIGTWEIGQLTQEAPTVFNDMVRVVKYRVTVEKIEEPIEVYQERLQKLYDESKNHHHWGPLKRESEKFNYEIKDRS